MKMEEIGIHDYQQFIKDLPVAVYACDVAGQIIFYNEPAVILWGARPIPDKDLWCGCGKIYHSDGRPMAPAACPMALTIAECRAIPGTEIIIERPGGERRHVVCYPRPLFDNGGNISGAITTLIDITDNKEKDRLVQQGEKRFLELEQKAEERIMAIMRQNEDLKKSEERYHKMVEEVRDYAILLLDKDGTILNWNKGAETIKGYSEKEILGENFRIFYLPEDREKNLPEKLINEAITTGKAMNEGLRVRKGGSTFWGSITITALHDDESNVIGFSKVTRDLTEKKLLDDRLMDYTRELERQNKELSRYSYVASHDLQEPLRKIQTFSSLANTTDDKDKLKEYLSKINGSAQRMSALIKGMLNYARISESEKEYIKTDLNGVFKNITEDFELQISEKNAVINCDKLPTIKVVPIEMYQLFSNLLSNALKFSEKQPVINITSNTITKKELGKYPELKQDTIYAEIKFSDNGIGFEPEYSQQVFDLFKRLNNPKAYTGTGLGLAVCKKIVEGHKGLIYAESEPGKGTTFTVYLPFM
jgi:PAS domain S-box-containing protein